MNEANPSQSQYGPGLLADYLAELLERFRHFSGLIEPAPGMVSHLARIKVSARLLASLAQVPGPAGEGFVRLGGVLSEWVARCESSPESLPLHMAFPLGRLADYLEELLTKRDQGVLPKELGQDPGWEAALDSFRHAGTPLAVLDEVEVLFRKWGSRWSESNLTPAQEQRLQRRWLSLRKRGDVLFFAAQRLAPPDDDSMDSASASEEILLLVDSSFRREEIRDKLTDRNYRVELPCDPAQALEFLATGPVPRAILCDNLEPTKHLTRMKEGMARTPNGAKIPVVLVVGSSLAGAADGERALQLGAVAAWREPFDPVEFHRILQRLPRA
jgi:CheY-like chemotaxis protein